MPHQELAQTICCPEFAADAPRVSVPAIAELSSLAVQSLHGLYEERERLFCRRMVRTNCGLRREPPSHRATVIALLGLERLRHSGTSPVLDVQGVRDAILADTGWVNSAADVGLLIWLTALSVPEQLSSTLRDFELDQVLHRYADALRGQTLSLAWFLSGVAHARLARVRTVPDLADVAIAAYRMLARNRGESGLFARAALSWPMGRILDRFGTFADQMHAVYALTVFAQAFEIDEPLELALHCANAIRALQGRLGQWWYLYDSRQGTVAKRYPVCSVHQDGAAPMALSALEKMANCSFHIPISRGLSWIASGNELRVDMRSRDQLAIWDRIDLRNRGIKFRQSLLRLFNGSREPRRNDLRVLYEVSAEHLGWLLYAFGNVGA